MTESLKFWLIGILKKENDISTYVMRLLFYRPEMLKWEMFIL